MPWVSGLLGVAILVYVLRGFRLERFVEVLDEADLRFLLLLPAALLVEQTLRAWKWRQLLAPFARVGPLRLLGSIMAGQLLAILIPLGVGAVARSWLVARRERLELPTVLATVAVDRLVDGVVFALLVPVALLNVAFVDQAGIRGLLFWIGTGSFVLLSTLLLLLVRSQDGLLAAEGRMVRTAGRLPFGVGERAVGMAAAFARGGAWPREPRRGVRVVGASLLIKPLAATHFLWAGLAFGVVLEPGDYLFLLVCLGFVGILGYFARAAGSFLLGAVFALGLLGVAEEQALAMALAVEGTNLLSIALIGALALWQQGVALAEADLDPSALEDRGQYRIDKGQG
ncbi:lysylphosphatidylglycerol synthase transmembrane domain-containing protein [Marinimicrococcus flavescens]|uniref:Lysylphosphatidylglycerol synthase transmembrane domain-containing protein n=1 Tax=Marinimicrococcus flavescens TaxID=3031815 RepID=A0AAP3XTK1_9PROT|nr:lysylphosphatidylglycerol synthase transmembrane domain-containing protein [Marinimicrococcus flavescens]